MGSFLRGTVAAIAAAALVGGIAAAQSPAASTPSDAGVELTWVDGGGAYHDAVVKAWLDPYAADTGVVFNYVGQTDNALVKSQVEAGAVEYSVYNGDNTWGLDTHAQWLEPLDYSIIKSKDQIVPGFATDYRIANMIYSIALAYNTDATKGAAPNGWADFFDLEKFPGKRGVMDYSVGGIFEIALLADGVAPEDLYPLDLDRAVAKLDTIKDQLVFWGSGAESEDLINSGEVAMAMMYNSRAWDAKAVLNGPVEISWPQQLLAAAYLTVPKGAANKDAAMRLIDYVTSAEHNGELSKYFTVAPTNTQATADPTLAPDLPTSHLDEPYAVFNDQWIAENQAHVEQVYQDWKSK